MKLVLIFGIAMALATRGCEKENEAGWENENIDEVGYVAEDIKVRKAVAEWKLFLKKSNEKVFSASKEISRAADRLDNPDTKSRRKLKANIIHAQEDLERLSEKLLKANRISIKEYDFDEKTPQKMKEFEDEINENIKHLNETLNELKSN